MTKSEIRALVKQRKTGGLSDRTANIKYGNRLIYKCIDIVLTKVFTQYISQNQITDDYLKTFFPYIQWDELQQMGYVKIPVSMLNIPGNQGLQWVSGSEDKFTSWIIQPNLSGQVFAGLEAGNIPDRIICYIEGARIMLPKFLKSQTELGLCAKIKIICGTDGYTEDEEMKVPELLTDKETFIDKVCFELQETKMTPVHVSNTGDPNTI